MYISNADWAFRQRFGGTPIQHILLVSLAMHANRNGKCRITVRRLTEDASCCERAAQSALKVLVDKDLITRRPTIDGDGARRADIYTVVGLAQRTEVVG